MNILLITDAYPPEIRSASHLMKELAEELNRREYRVTVATCQPRYNLNDTESKNNYPEFCDENGVKVFRINTLPHHKVNFLIRGVSQLSLPYLFCRKLRQYVKDSINAVVVYSPPLPLWRAGYYIKRTYGAKLILNVQDIFPQNAIDLGVLRNKLLIRMFEGIEKKAYAGADLVVVHSEGNRKFLIKRKFLSPEKVFTLHNWVNIDDSGALERQGGFRKKYGIEGKFIFFFGGVLGPSQALDLIIEIAKALQQHRDLVFLIVGDGTEKERLQDLVRTYSLQNVLLEPFISREEYSQLLKEVDVGLVCLSSKNKTPVVPGKILSYMAASVPVLAFLNRESDGHEIIRKARCGYSVVSDDLDKATAVVLKMWSERGRLKELGMNGYRFAARHYSKATCVDQFEVLLQR